MKIALNITQLISPRFIAKLYEFSKKLGSICVMWTILFTCVEGLKIITEIELKSLFELIDFEYTLLLSILLAAVITLFACSAAFIGKKYAINATKFLGGCINTTIQDVSTSLAYMGTGFIILSIIHDATPPSVELLISISVLVLSFITFDQEIKYSALCESSRGHGCAPVAFNSIDSSTSNPEKATKPTVKAKTACRNWKISLKFACIFRISSPHAGK